MNLVDHTVPSIKTRIEEVPTGTFFKFAGDGVSAKCTAR